MHTKQYQPDNLKRLFFKFPKAQNSQATAKQRIGINLCDDIDCLKRSYLATKDNFSLNSRYEVFIARCSANQIEQESVSNFLKNISNSPEAYVEVSQVVQAERIETEKLSHIMPIDSHLPQPPGFLVSKTFSEILLSAGIMHSSGSGRYLSSTSDMRIFLKAKLSIEGETQASSYQSFTQHLPSLKQVTESLSFEQKKFPTVFIESYSDPREVKNWDAEIDRRIVNLDQRIKGFFERTPCGIKDKIKRYFYCRRFRKDISKIAKIAHECHKNQKRNTGEVYTTHPLHIAEGIVSLLVAADYRLPDGDNFYAAADKLKRTLKVALLHDAVEDRPVETLQAILYSFSPFFKKLENLIHKKDKLLLEISSNATSFAEAVKADFPADPLIERFSAENINELLLKGGAFVIIGFNSENVATFIKDLMYLCKIKLFSTDEYWREIFPLAKDPARITKAVDRLHYFYTIKGAKPDGIPKAIAETVAFLIPTFWKTQEDTNDRFYTLVTSMYSNFFPEAIDHFLSAKSPGYSSLSPAEKAEEASNFLNYILRKAKLVRDHRAIFDDSCSNLFDNYQQEF